MLLDAELEVLARDIESNGLVEPIVVYGDQILDGRNRLRACELADVDPEFREWEGDESDILPWIISKNLHRRHLDTSQRSMVAAKLATLEHGERQTGKFAGVPTQGEAAELLNVSERSVRSAREVLTRGTPELVDQVERGEVSVSAAAAQLRPVLEVAEDSHDQRPADFPAISSEAEPPVSESPGYDGDSWSTPDDIIAAAREVLGGAIDLDPATNPTAQARIRATIHYTRETDGLAHRWSGRVWLNPPYSHPLVGQFVTRLLTEYEAGGVSAAILFVNNVTDTRWCQGLLERFPACFTSGRTAFLYDGEARVGTRQGQIAFYLGPNRELFAHVFRQFGVVVEAVAP